MMNRIIFMFFIVLPLSAGAQSLRFSLQADPQFSWMTADSKEIKTQGALLGINAGLGMDFYFAENYAFSTGLTINNLGGKVEYSDTLAFDLSSARIYIPKENIITYRLQYINVPLGLKFKTHEIGYTTFFANLGIAPMINIRSRATDESLIIDNDDIAENIMLFNMCYFVNLGVQYSLGGSAAIIGGLGYSSGFVDVTSLASDKININTLTVKLGILF